MKAMSVLYNHVNLQGGNPQYQLSQYVIDHEFNARTPPSIGVDASGVPSNEPSSSDGVTLSACVIEAN